MDDSGTTANSATLGHFTFENKRNGSRTIESVYPLEQQIIERRAGISRQIDEDMPIVAALDIVENFRDAHAKGLGRTPANQHKETKNQNLSHT